MSTGNELSNTRHDAKKMSYYHSIGSQINNTMKDQIIKDSEISGTIEKRNGFF